MYKQCKIVVLIIYTHYIFATMIRSYLHSISSCTAVLLLSILDAAESSIVQYYNVQYAVCFTTKGVFGLSSASWHHCSSGDHTNKSSLLFVTTRCLAVMLGYTDPISQPLLLCIPPGFFGLCQNGTCTQHTWHHPTCEWSCGECAATATCSCLLDLWSLSPVALLSAAAIWFSIGKISRRSGSSSTFIISSPRHLPCLFPPLHHHCPFSPAVKPSRRTRRTLYKKSSSCILQAYMGGTALLHLILHCFAMGPICASQHGPYGDVDQFLWQAFAVMLRQLVWALAGDTRSDNGCNPMEWTHHQLAALAS